MRGNVLDMAVGVVIGGAFGKITTSLVNDVIMPLVGMLIGGIDLGQLDIVLKPAVMNGDEVVTAAVTLGIGTFLTTIIDFILVALVIFLMIKAINRFHKKKEEAPAPEEPKGPTSEELLTEIRDLLNEYEFPGDDTPIIQGSALKALEDPNGEWGDKIMELMDTVDSYIPDPERDTDKPFVMPIEDVFSITGRGTVATGRVEAGTLHLNDEVEIVGIKEETQKSVVTGIEMFHKELDEAQAGDNAGTKVSEASDTAKVAGNAAKLSFTDSWGNQVRGNMTFDQGRLYLRLNTASPAEGAGVTPKVDGVLTREKAASVTQAPSVTPADNTDKTDLSSQDYIFPDSNSRYLTDEDLSGYSSDQLELAKNEIYARHGRKFVTQRIADYFNSKSWYKGTVEPETFDADTSVFNEYEVANIQKIADTEGKLRSEGK